MNIIALDDEQLPLELLNSAICQALPGEVPVCFTTAEEALAYAEQTPVDVAFLDINMSGMNGLELARRLTGIKPDTNIIFVTGYTEHYDEAFELYASGYVKKPVRSARVLREMENLRYKPRPELRLSLGPYTFDHTAQRVYNNGADTLLKPKEYHLFCLFANNLGVYFLPEELFQKIWGDEPNGDFRTVYSHISKLRNKLDIDNSEYDIEQKRGIGYRLTTPDCS